jgi:hypothetical protein
LEPFTGLIQSDEDDAEENLRIEPIYLVCGDDQDFFFTCKDKKKKEY